MSSIMIDKWSIENVIGYLGGNVNNYKINEYYHNRIEDLYHNPTTFEICWENFITAIILWDGIYSFNCQFIYDWKKSLKNKYLADSLEKIIYQVELNMINDSLRDIYIELSTGTSMLSPQSCERTLGYIIISNSLGVPFLAHPSRIYNDSYLFILNSLFTRLDIIDKIDKELNKYYLKVNEEIGRKFLKFNYPVLIDMIKKEAHTPEEELKIALEMREQKDVVLFRKKIQEIEQVINQGNTQVLMTELKLVSDLAKEITTKFDKKVFIGEFLISFTPSIGITPGFSRPISINTSIKPRLHTTFIRRLLNFGVNERNNGNYRER